MLTSYSSMSYGTHRILGNATMGCDNITYLHLGFPKYEIPPLFLLRDLCLPALTHLSFTAFMHFTLEVVGTLERVSMLSRFCTDSHPFASKPVMPGELMPPKLIPP